MGIPLMLQEKDNDRIEHLKKDFGIQKKIEVIRMALSLMEQEAERLNRIKRWQHAAKLVAKHSHQINKEFQRHSLIKKD